MCVTSTDLGEDGIDLAKNYEYDLILLNLDLPDIKGIDVLRRLRVCKISTPVLILTKNGTVEMKVKALRVGADDYLTKPFHKDELIARIHAIVRRSKGQAQSSIQIGNLVIHIDSKNVEMNGHPIDLSTKEYSLLELLALRKGKLVTHESILDHLYGGRDEPDPRVIDAFICRIRKKLAKANDGVGCIKTVWGRGFILLDTNASEDERATLTLVA